MTRRFAALGRFLAAIEQDVLFGNRDTVFPTIVPDQYFNHVGDAAMLLRGCGAQRIFQVRFDAKGQRRGLGCNVSVNTSPQAAAARVFAPKSFPD